MLGIYYKKNFILAFFLDIEITQIISNFLINLFKFKPIFWKLFFFIIVVIDITTYILISCTKNINTNNKNRIFLYLIFVILFFLIFSSFFY